MDKYMTLSAEEAYLIGVFEKIYAIEGLLRKVDLSKEREDFEREYEKLLDLFYQNLLDIDEMVEKYAANEERFLDELARLIKAGRHFDDLWDRYHHDKLNLTEFSSLLA
jgi:hypothetical protein